MYFGENWISVDPSVDYEDTRRAHPGGRRRLSGTAARRADLSQGAHPRGAHRLQRGDHDPDLRPRLARCATRPRSSRRPWRGSPGSSTSMSSCRPRSRRSTSRSTSRPRSATASSPATSGGPCRRWSRARRSTTPTGRARSSTSGSGARRRSATASRASRHPPRHARRHAGAPRRRRRRQHQADAECHQSRGQLAPDRRRGECRGTRSRSGGQGRRGGDGRDRLATRVPPRAHSANTPSDRRRRIA